MKKCIIIGGGIAGLSAAVFLSQNNISVELYESSPKLGGRASSFSFNHNFVSNYQQNHKSISLDNGQHLLMGCYEDTLHFLDIIGARKNLLIQKRLLSVFIDKTRKVHLVKASIALPYPLNLLGAFFGFTALNFRQKLIMLRFMITVFFTNPSSLSNLTVLEWLEINNQNEEIRKAFWEILTIGALNADPKFASAEIFCRMLHKIFFSGNQSSTFIIPNTDLTSMYCLPAEKYLIDNGNVIHLSSEVKEILYIDNKASAIRIGDKIVNDFDYLIIAVPPHAILKITGVERLLDISQIKFDYSPILSAHFFLSENKLTETFYGFIDSPIHWVFNHHSFISVVISNSTEYLSFSQEQILEMIKKELQLYLSISEKIITSYKIIHEKRATVVISPQSNSIRPHVKTNIANVFVIGDWVNTNLPATIESAVRSAKLAASFILSKS